MSLLKVLWYALVGFGAIGMMLDPDEGFATIARIGFGLIAMLVLHNWIWGLPIWQW